MALLEILYSSLHMSYLLGKLSTLTEQDFTTMLMILHYMCSPKILVIGPTYHPIKPFSGNFGSLLIHMYHSYFDCNLYSL